MRTSPFLPFPRLLGGAAPAFVLALAPAPAPAPAAPAPLFDGVSLAGWESATPERWRVEGGAIVSGDGRTKIPRNFFLFTEESFADFEFRCEFRLTGDPATGMINSGIQFRSQRLPNGYARGYQADIGDPAWWGCIYDEHRRNRVIARSDIAVVGPAVRRGDWNEYVIRCEGPRSRLWINGVLTVDYLERDRTIPLEGKIAVQIHSGGAAKVEFRQLTIEAFEKPESPLEPADQLAAFTVPDGYEVELVASEETGLPKPITVSFDDAGRMWAITATEYPVDANESPGRAAALWENGGKDRVVVFDQPLGPGPHRPRTFADGLAMPMGILPWKSGAIVGQGPEILFLDDTDGDGRADRRKVLVRGFGVQDSHLLPHQFTLLPDGWIAMAQGAFNRSRVVAAGGGAPVRFDYCKLGRFRPDGSAFETIGAGLNNIWGFVLGREGEMFIQEANDLNYSVVPFQVGSNYPGIGNQKLAPYAPFAPPLADFKLGGTGLSGLALADDRSGGFPHPWGGVMFVANPITRAINAVRVSGGDGGGYRLGRLPDFLTSSDPWFRPVAVCFGPDGCLYITDWYNKIISHNEVPRDHPERDRSRGRLWRVRHKDQQRREAPDLTSATDAELVPHLRSDSTWAMRAAWRQIGFRGARHLAPELKKLVGDAGAPADARVHALWALRDLGLADARTVGSLTRSPNRNLRREAAAVVAGAELADDPDPQVRAQAVRTLGRQPGDGALRALIAFAQPPLGDAGAGDRPPAGPVYDRAFERYLVRAALQRRPDELARLLNGPAAEGLPVENRLFAALSLPPDRALAPFVKAWSSVERDPDDEELLLLFQAAQDPKLSPELAGIFARPAKAAPLVRAALRLRARMDGDKAGRVLAPAVRSLARSPGNEDLVIEAVGSFRLNDLADVLAEIGEDQAAPVQRRAAAVQALASSGGAGHPAVGRLAAADDGPVPVRAAALAALAGGDDRAAAAQVPAITAGFPPPVRDRLIERLAGSSNGVDTILAGIGEKVFDPADLTLVVLDRMRALRPEDPRMVRLWEANGSRFPRALTLPGGNGDYGEAAIDLKGPFTVEAWVRLAPGISNEDGILGRPGGADFNFYGGKFRLYGGPGTGDLVVAKSSMHPGAWTHVAATRNPSGRTSIFLNGELDSAGTRRFRADLTGLDIGRTTPPGAGTEGEIVEFRAWDRARTPAEIRAAFDRRLDSGEARADGLLHHFPAGGDPQKLAGRAAVGAVAEGPPILDLARAAEETARLEKFMQISQTSGADPQKGKPLFQALCLGCHTLGGSGGNAAPPLDGSGHRETEALLRAVLTPDAAVEPGYRAFRVETHDGRLGEGFLVKRDDQGVTLRVIGGADLFFPAGEILRARFLNRSFMTSGLFDALPEAQVADLLAYIRTLKDEGPAQAFEKAFGAQVSPVGIKHSFLVTGPRTVLVGEDDRVLWSVDQNSRDGAVLPGGNILVAHKSVAREYTRDGKVVWTYEIGAGNAELERATRLADGRTLVVELGRRPRVVEVDRDGKLTAEVPLQPQTDNTHMQTRMVRKLANGNYLAPHLLAFAIKEYAPDGSVVRTIPTDLPELGGREARNWPFTAIDLADGSLLVNLTNGNKTVVFDRSGKVVWRVGNDTHHGLFADPCGAQRLANGNTVICSYGQRDGKKAKIFEITPDKKVVWEYYNPEVRAHNVHIVTTGGRAEPHPPLR